MQKSEKPKKEPEAEIPGRKGKRDFEVSSVSCDMLKRVAAVLKRNEISVFEYDQKTCAAVFYDDSLRKSTEVSDLLRHVDTDPRLYDDDRWKVRAFFEGNLRGPIEFRYTDSDGCLRRKMLDAVTAIEGGQGAGLLGTLHDVTEEKSREKILEDQARKDSLTGLYNQLFGK